MKVAVSPDHKGRALSACELCGTRFFSWAYEDRRYCSRACFHASRDVRIDLTGQRFGRWTVLRRDRSRPKGSQVYWHCRCDCGNERSVNTNTLRNGLSRSCRCIVSEVNTARNYKHGGTRSPEYLVWCNMRRRCLDPSDPNYPRYGARGITVCARWSDFAAFLADMGPRPSRRHSIERTDNSAAYAPENCAWATKAMQARNTRHNHTLSYDGRTQAITDWAAEVGINHQTLCARLNVLGWSVEKALTTPVKHRITP